MPLFRRAVSLACVGAALWGGLTIQANRPRPALPVPEDGLYRYAGAVHVHSRFSDGSGSVEEITAAAKRANLDYLVLTDHNVAQSAWVSGKREEGYRNSVLLIVGEEVNTSAGHLLAVGMDRYVEQRGDSGLSALLDTLAARGGLSIVAHPDGRRPWTNWSVEPFNGIELWNADTEWRNDRLFELVSALLWYPLAPTAALNTLIDRPDSVIARWVSLNKFQSVTGMGSVDAHASIPLFAGLTLPFPSYERLFTFIRTHVVLDAPLAGDVIQDKARLLGALRDGRCYTAVDSYEPASRFRFQIESPAQSVEIGGIIALTTGLHVKIKAESSGPVLIRLFRNGLSVAESTQMDWTVPTLGPGFYHVEVYQLRRSLPFTTPTPRLWIISNGIRVTEGR